MGAVLDTIKLVWDELEDGGKNDDSGTIVNTTLEAYYDDNEVAQLPYHIDVTFHNLTEGTQRTVFRPLARGEWGRHGSGLAIQNASA